MSAREQSRKLEFFVRLSFGNGIRIYDTKVSPMKALSSSWIIGAKLAPPQPMVSLIDRQDLIDRLDAARKCRLTLLESPAGYGKTTLLAQWSRALKAEGVTVAWLTLEEDEAEPLQFLSYAVAALVYAGADLGSLEQAAEQGFVDVQPKAAVAALVSALSAMRETAVLILDDYHRLQSSAVDMLVDYMLQHQPANFHLVINTRERPRLAIAGFRAQGHLLEISIDAMRFSVSEGQRIFGDTLSAREIEILIERTEGWAVALQLARLWLEEKRDRAALIEKFSGRISEIADYLAEQVLADLPRDLQDFLMKTSILERFDSGLANAVCGRTDSWEFLDRLDRLNCLLVPLDSERKWFRYHHLFADFLSDLLGRTQGGIVPALHQAASEWFEAQGLLRESVRHARLAGDLGRVARLIEHAGGWELVLFGGIGTLRNLLRNMPDSEILKYPRVALSRSYLHQKDGELAESRAIFDKLLAVSNIFESDGSPAQAALARDAMMVNTLLAVYEDTVLTKAGLAGIRERIIDQPQSDHMGHGCLACAICVIGLALGDMKQVVGAAIDGIRHMRMADSVLGANYGFLHLGQAYQFQGLIREAEATYREALDMAEDNFGSDSGLKAIAEVLLSSLLYLKNDLDGASDRLFDSLKYVENYDGWVDIYVAGFSTGAALKYAREGLRPALAFLEQGEHTATTRGLKRLSEIMRSTRLRFLTRAGQIEEATLVAAQIRADFKPGEWRETPEVWRRHHAAGAALAALYLEQGNPDDAPAILDDLEAMAMQNGLVLMLIETLTLRALVFAETGKIEAAIGCLDEAFRHSRGEAIRQIFLDEGPRMEKLLRQMLRKGRETFLVSMTKNFISDLLTRFQSRQNLGAEDESNSLFSRRETEVLGELSQSYSNKEIARHLDMTENTVKFHLKNIFAKLGVDKRTQAVSVARRMNLLP